MLTFSVVYCQGGEEGEDGSGGPQPKSIQLGRGSATNLSVLAERYWRFSVVKGDNSIVHPIFIQNQSL